MIINETLPSSTSGNSAFVYPRMQVNFRGKMKENTMVVFHQLNRDIETNFVLKRQNIMQQLLVFINFRQLQAILYVGCMEKVVKQ